MSSRLTIKLFTATNPPLDAFLQALQNTFDMLRDIDAAVSSKPQGTIVWRIAHLSVSSAVATLDADSVLEDADFSDEVVRAYTKGLEQIEQGPTIPPFFTEDTLEKAKRLVSTIRGEVTKITIQAQGIRPVAITQRVAANVDELIGPQYEAYGSIEGMLETLSVHGRPHFTIYDVLTRRGVQCLIPQGLVSKAHSAFQKRVAVSGKIKYTRRGKPVSISAEDLRVLREKHELPQAKDIEGIDLTGGTDPTEYIRRLRRAK